MKKRIFVIFLVVFLVGCNNNLKEQKNREVTAQYGNLELILSYPENIKHNHDIKLVSKITYKGVKEATLVHGKPIIESITIQNSKGEVVSKMDKFSNRVLYKDQVTTGQSFDTSFLTNFEEKGIYYITVITSSISDNSDSKPEKMSLRNVEVHVD